MAKSSMAKLVPKVPKVPTGVPSLGASRRQQYSASTKRALVDIAEELFTENGYANSSLDAIVAGAQVTKGALYHHFSGKQALFEAVFDRIETTSATHIQQALRGDRDPWHKARAGLRAFLAVVEQPGYRRIVVQDGPAVLGYERFREQEERTTYAIVVDIVRSVLSAGTWAIDEQMLHTFARIFFGAMSAAGESVTAADDPTAEATRVEVAIGFIIAGFQALDAAGVELPTTVADGPPALVGDTGLDADPAADPADDPADG